MSAFDFYKCLCFYKLDTKQRRKSSSYLDSDFERMMNICRPNDRQTSFSITLSFRITTLYWISFVTINEMETWTSRKPVIKYSAQGVKMWRWFSLFLVFLYWTQISNSIVIPWSLFSLLYYREILTSHNLNHDKLIKQIDAWKKLFVKQIKLICGLHFLVNSILSVQLQLKLFQD